MATQLVVPIALAALLVVGFLALDAWTRRTAHLNLGLFRPYRRDPWPIGVQEDDDFRFQWRASRSPSSATHTEDVATATIEDVAVGPGAVDRVRRRR